MFKLINFTVTVSLAIYMFLEDSLARQAVGDYCYGRWSCDDDAFLGCFDNRCQCVPQAVYEESQEKCSVRAGQICKSIYEDFYPYNCVQNAYCDKYNNCTCKSDYYANTNGTCSPQLKNGARCTQDEECMASIGLACIDGNCGCQNNDTTYSDIQEQCVGLAGRSCVMERCTDEATCWENLCRCDYRFYENSDGRCVKKLGHLSNCSLDNQCQNEDDQKQSCIAGKCQCDPKNSIFGTVKPRKTDLLTQCLGTVTNPCINGLCAPRSYCFTDRINPGKCTCEPQFALSQLGNCKAPYGGNCVSTQECIEGLVCGKKCRCRYVNQQFKSDSMQCVSPVGLPCDDLTGCTYGAECVKIRNTTMSRCQCKQEFVESAGGTCSLKFGIQCNGSSICDSSSGLECIEGICQCTYFKKYDPSLKKCVGLIGAPCNLNIPANNQCVENSKCLKVAGEPADGRCTCSEGFKIHTNYTCKVEAVTSSTDE